VHYSSIWVLSLAILASDSHDLFLSSFADAIARSTLTTLRTLARSDCSGDDFFDLFNMLHLTHSTQYCTIVVSN
jgi:hypothetical protein